MPRIESTTDVYTAIAEPRRRQILDFLAAGERGVNELARGLGIAQPQVSKHLHVLRETRLVSVRRDGRRRMYRLNGERLKSVHDWAATFERFWDQQLDAVKAAAELAARDG